MLTHEQFAKTLLYAGDAPTLIGTVVAGRYKVERLLGEGGMGAVYLVEHIGLRKRLALKLLRSDLVSIPGVLERFEREAMTAAHLDHPNVASAVDYGRTEDGRFYLVLEYVEGQELRVALDQAPGPQPLARALFITRQIASALARAHALGIVHRDLKPENIMLVTREGHADFVKVLDFGLAQVARRITDEGIAVHATPPSAKVTAIGDIFGTPAYMAPEQSIGDSTDVRTDLYSLGVILYELLTGKRPFAGKSLLELMQHHISTPPPPLRQRAPLIRAPKEVEALVYRLLAKKPAERIQRAEDLIAKIDRIVDAYQLVWPIERADDEALNQSPDSAIDLAKVEDTVLLWQKRLPRPIQRAPWWMFACAALFVVALPIGIALRQPLKTVPAVSIRPGSEAAAAPRPVEVLLAPQSAFEAAQDTNALETLASRYPADPRIKRVLLRSYTSQNLHVEAMGLIAKLALLEPDAGHDAEVIKSIVAATHGDGESMQAATTLMEQELGAAGVDLLYDLTAKPTSGRGKSRLQQSLTKPEVLAKASPAARLAVELRAAKRCEAKRELLERVPVDGDRRVLTQLKGLTQTDGCGFLGLQDCWPCLRKNSALRLAIATLESRINAQKPL